MIEQQNRTRPRVLQVAFACSPVHGSEWAVGWNRALESAKHFDTWVISQGGQQEAEIAKFFETNGPIDGLHFRFLPCSGIHYPSHPQGLNWLAYHAWQRRAVQLATKLHEELRFDLVHQVNNTGYREPGYLWTLDAPFVWGPIGGTHNSPSRFLLESGAYHGAREAVRSVLNHVQLRFSRRGKRAARRASVLLAPNSTSVQEFQRARGVQPGLMLETGVTQVSSAARPAKQDARPIRILWSGQFIPRKALSLLLKAIAELPPATCTLRVLGAGPLERRWKFLAEKLGIQDRVEWLGWLPHQQSLQQYEWADVFAFTSLRDNSGNVVLEALSKGLPVVCLDHQGVRDIVTEQCGLKIKVESPRQVVNDLRDGIATLANDDRRLAQMNEAAIARARDYLWSRLGSQMTDIYRRVLDERQPNPSQERVHDMPANHTTPSVAIKNAMRSVASWCALRMADVERLLTGSRSGGACGILMYHRVCDSTPGVSAPTWNVTPVQFRKQLSGLIAHGFQPWSLRKLIEAWRTQQPIPNRVFAVTFDDGYENNLVSALPVLRELGVPATVFLASAYIDSDQPFPCDDWPAAGKAAVPAESWRPLSTSQCRELLASGLIELGTHTHTHQDFRARPEEFRQDLAKSVDVLCDRFGVLQPPFAFPHGALSPELIEIAREVGVSCALSTEPKTVSAGDDVFGCGRFDVREHDSSTTLAAKLSGWYTKLIRGFRQPTFPQNDSIRGQAVRDGWSHALGGDDPGVRSSVDAISHPLSHR